MPIERKSRGPAELLAEVFAAQRDNGSQSAMYRQAVAQRIGMHPTDLETMDVLRRRPRMTAGQIAEATGLGTAAVTVLIDRLEARGLVRRVRDSRDRRKIHVEIDHDRADRRIFPFYQELAAKMAELFDGYADSELRAVRDFLIDGCALTRDAAERLRGGTG
jgi:DNA-binding MarR family transcriptional regulator